MSKKLLVYFTHYIVKILRGSFGFYFEKNQDLKSDIQT
jgi:hypothetical protein